MSSQRAGPLTALGVLLLLFTIVYYVREHSFTFFSPENLSNIVGQVMVVGVLAVSMTLVILIAEIDLGVGSVVAITAVVVSLLMQQGVAPALAVLAALVLGALIGAWNGFWVGRFRIHSFVVTLGMMVIGRGMAEIVSGRQNVSPHNEAFTSFFFTYVPPTASALLILVAFVLWAMLLLRNSAQQEKYGFGAVPDRTVMTQLVSGFLLFAFAGWIFCGSRGFPAPFILWLVVVGIGSFVLDNTPFGRHLYAVGGNSQAAGLSGIDVVRTKWTVFIVSGLLSGLAGILAASREGGATPGNIGRLNELDAIAAVVIGGTSLMGGIGHVRGTIVGLFLLAVLANGMSILGVPQDLQEVIKGVIIIIAAWYDARSKKR